MNLNRRVAMTFAQAKQYRIPFGKHRGKSLDEIAETDDGLRYLDWFRGEDPSSPSAIRAKEMIEVYLADEAIAKDLADMDDGEDMPDALDRWD